MSNDLQKADQIAHRCFSKLALLVHDARTPTPTTTTGGGNGPPPKLDRWFNLESPETDAYKDQLKVYKQLSAASQPTPSFEIDVLLAVPDLAANQVLVYRGGSGGQEPSSSSRVRVEPTPAYILLESWSLSFSGPAQHAGDVDLAPSSIYKHGIGLFRAVYALLRVAPAWKVHKRLQRRVQSRNATLNIQLRVRATQAQALRGPVLGFGAPLAPNVPPLQTVTHAFPPVPHPSGMLALSVTYLAAPQHFSLDDLESILDSRFFSIAENTDFTPTLIKNQQRDSLSSSPSSLAIRTSLPASPPVAVRQAGHHHHTRATSFPALGGSPALSSSPGTRPGLPSSTSRPSEMGSAISVASSRPGSTSREDVYGQPLPAATSRLRKESTGSIRGGADLPSSPGPLPIRRPPLNPLNPFKSSTLSSGSPSLHSPSPSLRQASPLTTAGLPSRPHPSPTSSRMPPSPIGSGALLRGGPPSPKPTPLAAPANASAKPSPPFTPGSLDRRSLHSAESSSVGTSAKRYSSSFGHRYRGDAGSNSGAGPSGGGGGGGSDGGSSNPSVNLPPQHGQAATADEDDLSAFVRAADAAVPLNRQYRAVTTDPNAPSPRLQDSPSPLRHPVPLPSAGGSPLSASPQGRRPLSRQHQLQREQQPAVEGEGNVLGLGLVTGPLLTSQAAVDEELVRMSERFNASLRELGSGRRRERTQSSPAPAFRRADRISEVTEESSTVGGGTSSGTSAASGSSRRVGSRAGSIGSEEVMGRMEIDERERRGGMR